MLLAIDDVHVADEPSLRWLLYLARHLVNAPVLVVLTWRTGRHQVSLTDLVLHPGCTVIRPRLLGAASMSAAELRKHASISLADQAFRDAMADAVALDARTRVEQALSGFTFHPVDPTKIDAIMAAVPVIATQAEIGALIAADSDRIKLDFNTRRQDGDPSLNSYHQWKSERGLVFEAQRRVGDELSSSINSAGRDAHAVVDQLLARFPELNRKFDEVTTAPQLEPYRKPGAKDRYTFYEHAQMVLGQYFTLTASENPDARLIPVDTLAKAILFHDMEKNNAKNQFGAGKGRHDREPEHKLAAQLMDRYRGLWSDEREFAAAWAQTLPTCRAVGAPSL